MSFSHLLQEVIADPAAPPAPHGVMGFLEQPHIKWAVPIPILLAIAPLIWLFFRSTWKELDEEAYQHRRALQEQRESVPPSSGGTAYRGSKPKAPKPFSGVDYRPLIALALGAFILTVQEYYGGRVTYDQVVRVWLFKKEQLKPGGFVSLAKYDELYALAYWALTRMAGYVLPLVVWRLFFRRDSVLDFGLRTRGFTEHAWIYAMFVTIMIPVMMVVAQQPDFGTYYPFYRNATRSWMDFGIWEVLYIGQFFCLEIFFRGWWVRATRSFGAGAIFSMVVPYCMIHFGKPYLEACGAIVAGTVLGSLSMKTRSIYAGFLVHITVAILMDLLALRNRAALPRLLTPEGTKVFVFTRVDIVLWVVWVFALTLLLWKLVKTWPQIRAYFTGLGKRAV